MIDLNKVALFAKVAESGSFSGAARALNMPKASVSRQVAQLEAALGVRLLHRTTRRVELTASGRAYVDETAHALSLIETANRRLAVAGSRPSGLIRVAAPVELGNRLLTQWIARFLTTFEDVRVELLLSDELVDLIGERIDVAFQGGEPTHPDFVARRLWAVRKILLASPAYLAARGEPRGIGDLPGHDFVVQARALDGASLRLRGPGGIETVRIAGRLAVDGSQAARAAAIEGLGIVALPDVLAAEDVAGGRLRHVLQTCEIDVGGIYAVCPNRERLPAVRAFVDFVAEAAPAAVRNAHAQRPLKSGRRRELRSGTDD